MKVAILVQPVPPGARIDQVDTLDQAKEVEECLIKLGHDPVIVFYVDHGEASTRALRAVAPDIVFNLVEEVPEGAHNVHLATALLDRLGLRYTGARTGELERLGHKRVMKQHLATAGLPVVPELGEAPDEAMFIVKSALEHGSLGLEVDSVVTGTAAAREVIAARTAQFGGEWFAEAYIDGREFDVAMLGTADGPKVFPVAEVEWENHDEGRPKVFGFKSKWIEGTPEATAIGHIFPPHDPLMDTVTALAVAAWKAFGLKGFAHVDFRVDAAGRASILEINANPCILRDACFCKAAAKGGMSQTDVVAALLAAA